MPHWLVQLNRLAVAGRHAGRVAGTEAIDHLNYSPDSFPAITCSMTPSNALRVVGLVT